MRVLIIGDTHCPVMHRGYVRHCARTRDKYKCTRVVHIGDAADNCALSFHKKPSHLRDARQEYAKAKKQLSSLHRSFPKLDWLIGNHDALPYRWCEEVGIDPSMMRDPVDMFGLKGWRSHSRYTQLMLDGVIYQHGDRGKGGQRLAALANAKEEFCSVVQGHHHGQAGAEFFANKEKLVFGMQVGCGIDAKAAAMEYGIKFNRKPVLGCGVVIDGETPIFVPMGL